MAAERTPQNPPVAAPTRRRLLLRGGVVLLAVLVLAVAPALLAAQPSFFKRFSAYAPAYESWATSTHASISCRQCHIEPGIVARSTHSARMLGEFYLAFLPISHEPELLGRPVNDACLMCHMDLRTVSTKGDLNIPHRAHIDMLEMECVDCHDHLVHEPGPHGATTPSMAGCLTCHDGEMAKSDCAACHTDKDPPETHLTGEWLIAHATAPVEECATCHDWTENWCSDCHAKRPVSHGDDWRATHRLAVEINRNCEACHQSPHCIRCHGIVPSLNLDPPLTPVP